MAESSIFWTTGATGDGASPYTQAQVIDWLRRTFIKTPASEGVLKGYANELAASGASSPVAIATGAAMVYGFPYENTASVNVVIPTPSIGTTGHRIVLRAGWAAQTVRITLISSADGVAAIPAAVQSAGTTWDVTLATLTITTGGAITLTDARAYIHPNVKVAMENIDDNAVTNAKMADNAVNTAEIVNDAVDDTKVGNRVPMLTRRVGGNATQWQIDGSTTYTPTTVKMQVGATAVNIGNGNSSAETAVTFPQAFSDVPLVIGSLRLNEEADMFEISFAPSSAGVGITARRAGTSGAVVAYVQWMAIGPE